MTDPINSTAVEKWHKVSLACAQRKVKILPDVDILRAILSYNRVDGSLTWLNRPAYLFDGSGRMSAKGVAAQWNSTWAGKPALTKKTNKYGYLGGRIFDEQVLAHRVIWKLVYGEDPLGVIDHINGNPSDNRIDNLRVVDDGENARNKKLSTANTTGSVGIRVNQKSGRWQARIKKNGVSINLGTFDNKELAIAARQTAEKEMGFGPNHGCGDHLTGGGE